MQKEALCISYPQFIGAETLKKEGLTYHSMYFVPKIANRQTLSIEVSYAQNEALCISYPQFIGAETETLKKEGQTYHSMYFVPKIANRQTLSMRYLTQRRIYVFRTHKKRGLCNLYPKIPETYREVKTIQNYMYFVPNFKMLKHCLSL